jgi:hypothetical protein
MKRIREAALDLVHASGTTTAPLTEEGQISSRVEQYFTVLTEVQAVPPERRRKHSGTCTLRATIWAATRGIAIPKVASRASVAAQAPVLSLKSAGLELLARWIVTPQCFSERFQVQMPEYHPEPRPRDG